MGGVRSGVWFLLLAGGSLVACESVPTGPAAVPDGPKFAISDAVHNDGNQHFFWLPPMVSAPSHAGTFDGGLGATVKICEWDGSACVLPLVAEFSTTAGPGSETVRVVHEDEHYIVNWHTNEFDLDPSRTYRLTASVNGQVLGHADVHLVSNGSQLRNVDTNEFIPLKDGRTLPIKFRIEVGAVATEITIEATALSAPSVDVRGPNGPIGLFPTAEPVVLPAEPGSYTVADRFAGNPIPFTITSSGGVDYDPHFDAIFSGRGTRTLSVLGHEYTVDATALSATFVQLGGIGIFPTAAPVVISELPGAKYALDHSGGVVHYQLTTDGLVSYAAELEPFLDGQATSTLTLVGYEYGVDATALSAPNILLGSIGHFSTATPAIVSGLPGIKNAQDPSGGVMFYELTSDGLIALDPQVTGFAGGEGTTTLILSGHAIQVDATALPPQGFTIAGIGQFPSTAVQTVVLLPGPVKTFIMTDFTFSFSVDEVGVLDYDGSLDPRVSGRGTSTLTILF